MQAQESIDSSLTISLATIATESVGNSYVTFPTDIGNMEPLWFEGNIIPNFILRTSKDARFIGVITPQIIIRMYKEESLPVKTPSYMPQITLYYNVANKTSLNSSNLFFKLAHHSNGQDGDFYLPDGTINTDNGNFSTNYFELGFIKTKYSERHKAIQFFSASIEAHPPSLSYDQLVGLYSLYRLNTVFSIFRVPNIGNNEKKKKSSVSVRIKSNWMFGDFNNLESYSINRLNISLRFAYHPKFLEDVGLFVQYYNGYDYYNIYFNQRRSVLRFGIITEKLRF